MFLFFSSYLYIIMFCFLGFFLVQPFCSKTSFSVHHSGKPLSCFASFCVNLLCVCHHFGDLHQFVTTLLVFFLSLLLADNWIIAQNIIVILRYCVYLWVIFALWVTEFWKKNSFEFCHVINTIPKKFQIKAISFALPARVSESWSRPIILHCRNKCKEEASVLSKSGI